MKRALPEILAVVIFVLVMMGIASCCQSCAAECADGSCPPGYHSPDRVMASVRIGNRGGCAGTIIRIEPLPPQFAVPKLDDDRRAWGISAAHCASKVGDQFVFSSPDGRSAQARWLAIDKVRDLSLFVCWAKDTNAAAKVTADFTPDWKQKPIVEAIGFPSGNGPKWKRFARRSQGIIRESGTGKRFLRNRFVNRGPGVFAPGDSGGGVFLDGWLVGVMTHGGPSVATHRQVVEFLQENRDQFGGVDPFQGWQPKKPRPGWLQPNVPLIPRPSVDEEKERLKNEKERLKEANGHLSKRLHQAEADLAARKDVIEKLKDAARDREQQLANVQAELQHHHETAAAESPAEPAEENHLPIVIAVCVGVCIIAFVLLR